MDKKFFNNVIDKKGITTRQLAEKIGLSEDSLKRRISGITKWKVKEVLRVAEVLELGGNDTEEMFFR